MKKVLSIIIAAVIAAAISSVYVGAEDGYTPPHEHDWEFVSHTDYTCDEEGYDLYVCAGCGEEVKRVTDPASHRNDLTSELDATCETEGKLIYLCSVCGEETVVTTPALGHLWSEGEVVKEATLFTVGKTKFVCKRDDSHVKFEDIPSEIETDSAAASSVVSVACVVLLALAVSAITVIIRKKRDN